LGKIACDHCQLVFKEDVLIHEIIDDKDRYFCCKGCEGVYHLLHSEGLDSFYEKIGDTKLDPAKERALDLEKFDLEGFAKKYIKDRDGFNEISLIIEGIHCSACVWLNEKVLHNSDGILEAEINYTNHKAKIVWDPSVLKLSDIIMKIQSIGYNAYPYDASLQEERANKQRTDYYSRLLVGVFATMNIMWLAIAQYAGYFTGISDSDKNVLNIAEFVLATPALFYTGWVYFRGAYFGLKNRFINMDFLVATGATLAYIYSIYAMISGVGEVYFDSVAMIITFVFVGKYLEVLGKKQAVDTMDSLMGSLPTEVLVIDGDEKSLVLVEEVKVGDLIEVKSGDKIVIDGQIISGQGSFDESSLSGESEPIYKKEGDEVLSGSILLDSVVRYRATKEFGNSLLSTIVSLLEDSITKKPRIERLANEISGYFSVVILVIAIAAFLGWYFFGDSGFEKALIISISVIVIACPCALGLATPVATLIGLSEGAKRGILYKEASFLETMAKANILFLDKTGTITEGRPEVVDAEIIKEFDKNILYSLVKTSSHPISKGIATYLENSGELQEYPLEDIKSIEAKGLSAIYEGKTLLGGNDRLLSEHGIFIEGDHDGSIFAFGIDGELVALYLLKDKIKDDTKESIKEIIDSGVEVVMLTGDHEGVAKGVASAVGIQRYYSRLYPQDKAQFIDDAHKKGQIVIMAGDGINDALALSKSDIAISMGSGSDISISVSDVVLLDNKISSLATSVKLSQKTFHNVKQNLALSLLYNLFAIPLAVAGFVIPLVAALSMSLSSLIVIANAIRIKRGL